MVFTFSNWNNQQLHFIQSEKHQEKRRERGKIVIFSELEREVCDFKYQESSKKARNEYKKKKNQNNVNIMKILFFKMLAFGYKIGGTHCKTIKIMS